MVRRFELPRQIQWQQLRHEWHWFYALGVTHRHLTLVRGIWEGDCQSLSWDCTAQEVQSGFVFEPTAERGRAVALARASGRPLGRKRFPAADAFFGQECIAGTPDWLPAQSYPLTFGEDVAWSLHLAAGQAVLSCHDKTQGRLQRTIDATEALLGDAHRSETTRLCLAALPSGVAMTLGNRLVLTRRDGGLTRVELPGQAIGLVATLPHTRSGIAVLLEHGAVMHWAGVDVGSPIELSRDLASPLATFVPGGPMVLVSDAQMMLLDVDSRGVQKVTRVELTGQRPVGVCYTAAPGQFAVLGDSGEMTVYRVPL